MAQSNSFTRFPLLPRELRDVIWTYSLPDQRIVSYWPSKRSDPDPAALQVCTESRQIAQKFYTQIVHRVSEFLSMRASYIDFEMDSVLWDTICDFTSPQVFSSGQDIDEWFLPPVQDLNRITRITFQEILFQPPNFQRRSETQVQRFAVYTLLSAAVGRDRDNALCTDNIQLCQIGEAMDLCPNLKEVTIMVLWDPRRQTWSHVNSVIQEVEYKLREKLERAEKNDPTFSFPKIRYEPAPLPWRDWPLIP